MRRKFTKAKAEIEASLEMEKLHMESQQLDIVELSSDEEMPTPRPRIRQRDILESVRDSRGFPIHVQCDRCSKWRQTDYDDPTEVPSYWECSMNIGMPKNSCSQDEDEFPEKILPLFIHNTYTAGSVVWAKLDGYPWWPGMVDDCPDQAQFFWTTDNPITPSHYNVTFYEKDKVTRHWLPVSKIKPYQENPNLDESMTKLEKLKYGPRISGGKIFAEEALKYKVFKRIRKYGFLNLYKGEIKTPPRPSPEDLEGFENRKEKPKKSVAKKAILFEEEISENTLTDSSCKSDKITATKSKKRKRLVCSTPKRRRIDADETYRASFKPTNPSDGTGVQTRSRQKKGAQPAPAETYPWDMSYESSSTIPPRESPKSEAANATLGSLVFNLTEDQEVQSPEYSPPFTD